MSAEQLAKVAEFQRITAELMGMGLQPAQDAMAPVPSPAPSAAPQAATTAPSTTKLSTGATIPMKKDPSKLKSSKSSSSRANLKQVATPGSARLDPPTSGTPAGSTPARDERSRPLYVPTNAPTSGPLATPPAREAAPAGNQGTQGRASSLSGQQNPPSSQLDTSRGRTQSLTPARMDPPRSRSRE